VKIDEIVWKAMWYYIFLVFFRLSIVAIGIDEIEKFLWDLLTYLPSLFIAVIILFFWVRFANFIYDVIYQTLNLTKQKTAKIIASWAKIIILFFTLMVVLDKVGIASDIITVILTGFVAMLTLAGWIAFGLGWKDVAREILESLRK
jgi:small-conductance mechanosensitive channel